MKLPWDTITGLKKERDFNKGLERRKRRAIRELDLEWIRENLPEACAKVSPSAHLAGLHKTRMEMADSTDEEKAESLAWLIRRGMGRFGASYEKEKK